MTQIEKQTMYSEIEKHGNNLNVIFNTGLDAITLCKKLRRLENKAHQIATNYCNGENGVTTENIDSFTAPILPQVYKILGTHKYRISFNGDARGYSLKISEKIVKAFDLKIYTDWGGNGIIAPDFTPTN